LVIIDVILAWDAHYSCVCISGLRIKFTQVKWDAVGGKVHSVPINVHFISWEESLG
jgi:hypothetical protein